MRNWLIILTITMLLACGALVVSAADVDYGTAEISGNLYYGYIDISVIGNLTNWMLTPLATNENHTAIKVIVATDANRWAVNTLDYDDEHNIGGKSEWGMMGYLGSWNGTAYTGTFLYEPIMFKAANATWEGRSWSPSDAILAYPEFSNSPGEYEIWIRQNTTANDQVLTGGDIYRYVLSIRGLILT